MAGVRPVRDQESLRFLMTLGNRDPNVRNQAFETIQQNIDLLISGGYGSPVPPTNTSEISDFQNDFDIKLSKVQERLPDFLRIIHSCPFTDVSEKCKWYLEDLQVRGKGLKIPRRIGCVSTFIPENEIIPPDTNKEQTQMLFIDAFIQNNRLDHVTQLMGYHPEYLDCFLKTQQYLLRGDGPLPYHFRHYIAIMAAGRHQCSYLINLHIQEFILQGGDPNWLNGLHCIPQKLRDLYEINKILAHRPWLIQKSHIEKLTQGEANWSVSELVHALVLLAHFHALCSFVYGCGISTEVDHDGGYSYRPSLGTDKNCNVEQRSSESSISSSPESNEDLGITDLMERMKRLTEEDEGSEMTQEELLKQFEKVEHQTAELTTNTHTPSPREDVLKFVENADFVYQDFAKRGSVSEIPTFRAQDYSWEDHGFSLANRYYSDVGTLLDDRFKCAYNLTYYTLGDIMNVDTTMFRRAVWNYIHCMYGIRHDDYNYGEVNQMLERNLKAYIKTVTCYPERLTKKDYDNVMREFKHSEKVHVNLMLLEARLQGELLYSLRAVMQYMT